MHSAFRQVLLIEYFIPDRSFIASGRPETAPRPHLIISVDRSSGCFLSGIVLQSFDTTVDDLTSLAASVGIVIFLFMVVHFSRRTLPERIF
jgi:hypothetical protein